MRKRSIVSRKYILIGLILWALGIGPGAVQQFVYPAKGQSPDQQSKDEGEC